MYENTAPTEQNAYGYLLLSCVPIFWIKALTLIYSIQNLSHKLKSGWCHKNDKYAAILAENCNL